MRVLRVVLAALSVAGPCAGLDVIAVVPDGDVHSQQTAALLETALRYGGDSLVLPRSQVLWVMEQARTGARPLPEVAGRLGAARLILCHLGHEQAAVVYVDIWDENGGEPQTCAKALARGMEGITSAVQQLAEKTNLLPRWEKVQAERWHGALSAQALANFGAGLLAGATYAGADNAIRLLSNAVAAEPNFPEARRELGNLLMEKGLYAEAVAQYRAALEVWPDYDIARSNLGYALLRMGDVQAAELELRQIATQGQDPMAVALARNNLAVLLRQAGKVEEAQKELGGALAILPTYAMPWANIGQLRMRQGDDAGAAEAFNRAIDLDNDPTAISYAYRSLGDMHRQRQRYAEAVAAYQQALAVRPEYAMVHVNLGVTLKLLGRLEEAVQEYRKAVELNNDPTATAYGHNNLGNIYLSQGKLDEAIQEFQAALAIMPDYETARRNLEEAVKGRQ